MKEIKMRFFSNNYLTKAKLFNLMLENNNKTNIILGSNNKKSLKNLLFTGNKKCSSCGH